MGTGDGFGDAEAGEAEAGRTDSGCARGRHHRHRGNLTAGAVAADDSERAPVVPREGRSGAGNQGRLRAGRQHPVEGACVRVRAFGGNRAAAHQRTDEGGACAGSARGKEARATEGKKALPLQADRSGRKNPPCAHERNNEVGNCARAWCYVGYTQQVYEADGDKVVLIAVKAYQKPSVDMLYSK